MSSSVSDISTRTSLLAVVLASCAGSTVSWNGVAIAPGEDSTRESRVGGILERAECFEDAVVVLDRSFESRGFDGVPFAIETGRGDVLILESQGAALYVQLESSDRELVVVERFIPHFFVDTIVPGVSDPVGYTLVCKGGTGRMRMERDGGEVRGDLAIRVACRTYVGGTERDESEIHLSGEFRAVLKSSTAPR